MTKKSTPKKTVKKKVIKPKTDSQIKEWNIALKEEYRLKKNYKLRLNPDIRK